MARTDVDASASLSALKATVLAAETRESREHGVYKNVMLESQGLEKLPSHRSSHRSSHTSILHHQYYEEYITREQIISALFNLISDSIPSPSIQRPSKHSNSTA